MLEDGRGGVQASLDSPVPFFPTQQLLCLQKLFIQGPLDLLLPVLKLDILTTHLLEVHFVLCDGPCLVTKDDPYPPEFFRDVTVPRSARDLLVGVNEIRENYLAEIQIHPQTHRDDATQQQNVLYY